MLRSRRPTTTHIMEIADGQTHLPLQLPGVHPLRPRCLRVSSGGRRRTRQRTEALRDTEEEHEQQEAGNWDSPEHGAVSENMNTTRMEHPAMPRREMFRELLLARRASEVAFGPEGHLAGASG